MSTSAARLRRLEARIVRLEAAALVPPDAAVVMARIAATQPVSPAEQARHRADLLAAVYGKPEARNTRTDRKDSSRTSASALRDAARDPNQSPTRRTRS